MIERSLARTAAGAAGEFSSPGSAVSVLTHFSIRSTPVLPQKHVKDPGYFAKSAGGRLQIDTHAPYVCGCARSDTVHGCLAYTERAEMAGSSFMWHQLCQRCKYTTGGYLKTRYKTLVTHVESHTSAVSLLESEAQGYVKAINKYDPGWS